MYFLPHVIWRCSGRIGRAAPTGAAPDAGAERVEVSTFNEDDEVELEPEEVGLPPSLPHLYTCPHVSCANDLIGW